MKPFSLLRTVGLLVGLVLAGVFSAAAQAPAWQTARAVAAVRASAGSGISATAVDAAGNVYLAGSFSGNLLLGSTTLTSSGSNDVFVAKFSSVDNQLLWAQRAGGVRNDVATSLAVSGTNVYVAGYFSGSAASFGSTVLTSAGSVDVFVAKLTDAGGTGSFIWAQRAGGAEVDQTFALATSGTSVYLAGCFDSSASAFGSTILTGVGVLDVFVAKLNDAGGTGSFVWAQRAGGVGSEQATTLAVSGSSVYVGGYFDSSIVSFGGTILTSLNSQDGFVAKLTDSGIASTFVWAQRVGGTDYDLINAICVSGSNEAV